jgi:hypothetical protein
MKSHGRCHRAQGGQGRVHRRWRALRFVRPINREFLDLIVAMTEQPRGGSSGLAPLAFGPDWADAKRSGQARYRPVLRSRRHPEPGRKQRQAARSERPVGLLRSPLDRIELTPNDQGRLGIDLYGDLAGILSLASSKDRPLEASDPSVQQVKVVAGAGSGLCEIFSARGLEVGI